MSRSLCIYQSNPELRQYAKVTRILDLSNLMGGWEWTKTERVGLVTLQKTLHKQTTTSFQQQLQSLRLPPTYVTVIGIKDCAAVVSRPVLPTVSLAVVSFFLA